jgi:hypothetical protein
MSEVRGKRVREEMLSGNARPSSQPALVPSFPQRQSCFCRALRNARQTSHNEPTFTHHHHRTAWTDLALVPPVALSELRRL